MPTVKIDAAGQLTFIWTDRLKPLFDEGHGTIARASNVEPTAQGKWTADMYPSGGLVLGPFETRGEALVEEVVWLEKHIIKSVAK